MSMKISNLFRFAKAYIKSMRLYYAFITGIAGWIGVSFHAFCAPEQTSQPRNILLLAMLFLSWGINQIINDFQGLPEDRINAPNRPMVTGELSPIPALAVSGVLMAGVVAVSWFLNPHSVIPVLLGVGLNILYGHAKRWSLMGNVIFGLSIAMCTAYGFLAAGPTPTPLFNSNRISALILVALMNGLMTFYTYFKDYRGDKRAGVKTFIVRHGPRAARYAGLVGALLPLSFFLLCMKMQWLPFSAILYPRDFIFCGIMATLLQVWTAILFFRNPTGERTYFSLAMNIRACTAGQIALIAIFNGTLALYLFSASYIFIGFLFNLYKDARS
ncbi:MAG: UbiA prenyltransferase family protein [Pontiellaceae bacterium]|nr:UbiA prenyltransferase family protein [Pontiellaceae bacterium]